jgi:Xaa-Pro aminopeptidase
MRELGVDVLLLSTGADLPYVTGYEAMPLERLTMLVLPAEADARLVIPRLEAPRVVAQPDAFVCLSSALVVVVHMEPDAVEL